MPSDKDPVDELLRSIHYDPSRGYGGAAKLWDTAKKHVEKHGKVPGLTLARVKEWHSNQELTQVRAKPPFKGHFRIIAPPRTFQVDVVFFGEGFKSAMQDGEQGRAAAEASDEEAEVPRRRRSKPPPPKPVSDVYLMGVDVLSRYLVLVPMADHTAESIVSALDVLAAAGGMNKADPLIGIEGDAEFAAEKVEAWCAKHRVMLTADVAADDHETRGKLSGDRLGTLNRVVRTLKLLIDAHIRTHDELGANELRHLVNNYNEAAHGAMRGRCPNEVWADKELQAEIYSRGLDHNTAQRAAVPIAVGDVVRRRVGTGKMAKESANFSSRRYVVDSVDGNRYYIRPETPRGAPPADVIMRRYKYYELLKVKGVAAESTAAGEARLAGAQLAAAAKRRLAREGIEAAGQQLDVHALAAAQPEGPKRTRRRKGAPAPKAAAEEAPAKPKRKPGRPKGSGRKAKKAAAEAEPQAPRRSSRRKAA